MSLQSINSLNNIYFSKNKSHSSQPINNGSAFRVYDAEQKAPLKVKVGVALTTVASVIAAYAMILKHKGVLKNPLRTPFKEWGIFNIKYNKKEDIKLIEKSAGNLGASFQNKLTHFIETHDIETSVAALAISSVTGGLIGGAAFDKKENMNAKYREAVIQLLGNVFTPLACVSLGMRSFKKYEPQIVKFLNCSKKTEGIPGVAATLLSLTAGIFLGNKVGNTINEKCFRVKDNRKIKLTDMSPHIDDLCIAASVAAAEGDSALSNFVGRIIPLALLIPGLAVGTTQEKPHIKEVHKQRAEERAQQKAMKAALKK